MTPTAGLTERKTSELRTKPRVILLATNLARGGAETQVALLAKVLRRRGWPVTVVSMMEPTAFVEDLREADVEVESLGIRPGGLPIGGAVRLAKLLRRERPGILHAHMFHGNLLGRLMALVYPAPVVISTIHSLAESNRKTGSMGGRDACYKYTSWLATYTTCVSHAIASRYLTMKAVSPTRLRVVSNGVDGNQFRPDEARRNKLRSELELGDGFVWLAAGRLMWKKDYGTMLEAMAIQQEGLLLIAGDGPLAEKLHAHAASLSASSRIRFLGPRTDVASLMNACDGFVLSSVVEGLPMVLLEAAHSGLPCVTTDVSGAREAVLDGETGFVTPLQDVKALAAAMNRVMAMPPEKRIAMGAAARTHASARFEMEEVTTRWEELYHQGLQAAGIDRLS